MSAQAPAPAARLRLVLQRLLVVLSLLASGVAMESQHQCALEDGLASHLACHDGVPSGR